MKVVEGTARSMGLRVSVDCLKLHLKDRGEGISRWLDT
jgi:hypothetical protein